MLVLLCQKQSRAPGVQCGSHSALLLCLGKKGLNCAAGWLWCQERACYCSQIWGYFLAFECSEARTRPCWTLVDTWACCHQGDSSAALQRCMVLCVPTGTRQQWWHSQDADDSVLSLRKAQVSQPTEFISSDARCCLCSIALQPCCSAVCSSRAMKF